MSLTARTIKQHRGKNETYHASVSGGKQVHWIRVDKIHKNDYLIRSQLSLILSSAIKSLHVSYAKVHAEYSQMVLIGVLGHLLSLVLFWGGVDYLKLQNHHALLLHSLASCFHSLYGENEPTVQTSYLCVNIKASPCKLFIQ